MEKKYYAGLLGYYCAGVDEEYEKKRALANKQVDLYNKYVHSLPLEEQMEYQKQTLELIKKILE